MAADRVPAKVAARCGCGRPVEPGHRYCPDCGSLVGHLAGESDGVDLGVGSGDPSVLLGPVAGPVRDVARVQTGGWGLGYRLLAIGAAAVVVLLVWGLFRQPSDEVVPEPVEGDEASVSDEAGDAADAPADGDGEGERADAGSTTTARSTTEVLPGGPLLGEETGLTLVSKPGNGIRLLDLDDGTVTEIDRVVGQPLATLGSTLVLQQSADLSLLDLADPEAEARSLLGDGETPEQVVLVDIADGLIWVEVYTEGGDYGGLRGYDDQGRLQAEQFVDQAGVFGQGMGRLVHAAGGIYRPEGDGYRRVSTGVLRAVGDELALIIDCGDTLDCRSRWVDILTWTDAGHPDPPSAGRWAGSDIVGSDRWLVVYDWETDRVRLVDIATGEVAHEMPARGVVNSSESVTVTDDGRWLVDSSAQGSGEAVIVDLDSGAEWPLPERTGSGATVFVDSSLVGSPVADPSIDGEAEGGDG